MASISPDDPGVDALDQPGELVGRCGWFDPADAILATILTLGAIGFFVVGSLVHWVIG